MTLQPKQQQQEKGVKDAKIHETWLSSICMRW